MNTRTVQRAIAAASALVLITAVSAAAQSQGPSSTSSADTALTYQATSTQGSTTAVPSVQASYNTGNDREYSWFGSGLVGSSFAQTADDANVNVGLSVGYLFRPAVGVEFAADFSPNFVVDEVPLGENQVNSYMVNLVGAIPIGTDAMIQPFVEGGLGAITLRSDEQQFGGPLFPGISDNQFAYNLGAGLMGFRNHWGWRADVRYVRGVGGESMAGAGTALDAVGPNGLDDNGNFVLDDVDFWRTNVGVAFRW